MRKTSANKLFFIPYAFGGETGCNIQNQSKQFDTYLKNCCVALISARRFNDSDTDVALITNTDIPAKYASLLKDDGIQIITHSFDTFNFKKLIDKGIKVKWQLAFYKLCALYYCASELDYESYSFSDSDIFIQGSFDQIWEDSKNNILLLDIKAPITDPMQQEILEFEGVQTYKHFGGEFFASSSNLAKRFSENCYHIYEDMIRKEFITIQGDEFITSIAAGRMDECISDASKYINRYWTGAYRLVPNDYKDSESLVILHIPAEKEQGMLRLFNKYISHGELPAREKVWKLLHLNHRSIRVIIGTTLRKLGFKI